MPEKGCTTKWKELASSSNPLLLISHLILRAQKKYNLEEIPPTGSASSVDLVHSETFPPTLTKISIETISLTIPMVPMSSTIPMMPMSSTTPMVPMSSTTPMVRMSSTTQMEPISSTAPMVPMSSTTRWYQWVRLLRYCPIVWLLR